MNVIKKILLSAILIFVLLAVLGFVGILFQGFESPLAAIIFLIVVGVIGGAIWKIIKHKPTASGDNMAQDAFSGAAAGGKRALKAAFTYIVIFTVIFILYAVLS